MALKKNKKLQELVIDFFSIAEDTLWESGYNEFSFEYFDMINLIKKINKLDAKRINVYLIDTSEIFDQQEMFLVGPLSKITKQFENLYQKAKEQKEEKIKLQEMQKQAAEIFNNILKETGITLDNSGKYSKDRNIFEIFLMHPDKIEEMLRAVKNRTFW